jgi:hypothetical protein
VLVQSRAARDAEPIELTTRIHVRRMNADESAVPHR